MRKPERKACRKEVKATLKRLETKPPARADVTRNWIAGKCLRCLGCPKMVRHAVTTRPSALDRLG